MRREGKASPVRLRRRVRGRKYPEDGKAQCSVHPVPRRTAHWPRSHCINQQTGVVARTVADSRMKLSFILRIFLIRITRTWPSSIFYRRPWRRWQRKPGASSWTLCESVGLHFQRTKSRKVGIASFRYKFVL